MADFANAYAGAIPPGGPQADTTQPEVRRQWQSLNSEQFVQICESAYDSGDFGYASVALQTNHNGIKQTIQEMQSRAAREGHEPCVEESEAFELLKMTQKVNDVLLSMVGRTRYEMLEMQRLAERVKATEDSLNNQDRMANNLNKIAESTAGGKGGGHAKTRPVSEFKAVQNLKTFSWDRAKFRERNDKLINALAQLNGNYRQAIKNLNRKLENMDGSL